VAPSEPRIYSILVVKNEADVVGDAIDAALAWSEAILVLDNASTDETWEIVLDAARRSGRVFPYLRTDEPFSDGLRARLYQAYRHLPRAGADWWCLLDADEFHVADPRPVLARAPRSCNAILGSFFTYYFTSVDAAAYRDDPEDWLKRPLFDRLRWYRNDGANIRCFRHNPRAHWVDTEWPDAYPVFHSERINIRHFRYRSPEQIAARITSRRQSAPHRHERVKWEVFPFEATPDEPWLERVANESLLQFDDGSRLVEHPEADLLMPSPPTRIRRWTVDHAVRPARRVRNRIRGRQLEWWEK